MSNIRIRQLFIMLSLLYFLGSCTTPTEPSTSNVVMLQGNETPTTVEADMLAAINTSRNTGAICATATFPKSPPLTWHVALSGAAKTHVMDLLKREENGEFDLTTMAPPHIDSDGKRVSDRTQQQGSPFITVAENLASVSDNVSQIEQTVSSWLASTRGHCEAMLQANFQEVGIYFSEGIWAVVFGEPAK